MIAIPFIILALALSAVLGFRYSTRVRTLVYRNYLLLLRADHLDVLAERRSYFLILIEVLRKNEVFRKKHEILWEAMEEWRAMYYDFMQHKSDYADLLDKALLMDTEMNQIYSYVETDDIEALEVLTRLNESVSVKNAMAIEWLVRTRPGFTKKIKEGGLAKTLIELYNS